MTILDAILVPITGPLEVFQFADLSDVVEEIGAGEDKPLIRALNPEFLLVSHVTAVGPGCAYNERATTLASTNSHNRVYYPAAYIRGSVLGPGTVDLQPLGYDHDEVMSMLYSKFAHPPRRGWAPPVP